jgi:hypothetical protein
MKYSIDYDVTQKFIIITTKAWYCILSQDSLN